MSEPFSFMDDLELFDWSAYDVGLPDADWARLSYAPFGSAGVVSTQTEQGTGIPHRPSHDEPNELPSMQSMLDDTALSIPPFPKAVYLRTTCATCDASLDTSEQDFHLSQPTISCTANRSAEHLPLLCQSCGEKFRGFIDLKRHSLETKHKSFNCVVSTCQQALEGHWFGVSQHFKDCHPDIKYTCNQCAQVFNTSGELEYHCFDQSHQGYICRFPECNVTCAQQKELRRHELKHKAITVKYPCPHCRSYRGNNGFKRKDHLRQHIRNYHRMEDYQIELKCAFHPRILNGLVRENGSIFKPCWATLSSLENLAEHMLVQHQSSAFICHEKNCDRTGLNGFTDKKEFNRHVKYDHPSPFQCSILGCDRVGSKGWRRKTDMIKHMQKKHGQAVVEGTTA